MTNDRVLMGVRKLWELADEMRPSIVRTASIFSRNEILSNSTFYYLHHGI
jgi:hypothetical protein